MISGPDGDPKYSEAHVLAYAMFKWDPFGREALGRLDGDHFSDPYHLEVFRLLQEGQEIDEPDAVFSFVRQRTSDLKALTRLIGHHCGHGEDRRSHFAYHMGQLSRSRAERRIRGLGASLVEYLDSGELPIREIRAECESLEKSMAEEVTEVDLLDLVADINDPERPASWIGTGSVILDEHISGLRAGDLVVIAGTTGAGKSSFAINAVRHNASKSRGVLIASYEMSRADIWYRIFASESGIPLKRFLDKALTPDNRREFAELVNELSKWPMHIACPEDCTVQGLESLARNLHDKSPLSLVVVDYLQLMDGANKKASNYEGVSEISKSLKRLARVLELPVIALAQLNREAAKDRPKLHHLRDSGQIEQDADTVLMLRPHGFSVQRTISIQLEKVRRGEAGVEIDVTFDGSIQRWTEPNRVSEFDSFNKGSEF